MIKKAVYAGSFDPLTNGHLWIIKEAANLFDELVVAVAENIEKEYTFSLQERKQMLENTLNIFKNVSITSFANEYLVNYANQIDAEFIVRGIRNVADYEYEKSMSYINKDINNKIKTIFFIPPREFVAISSSVVKGLIGIHGWKKVVSKYIPEEVYARICELKS